MIGKAYLILFTCCFTILAPAQTHVPQFEDYMVADVFRGKPAAPILKTKSDRLFRTRIREAAKAGPNFAGNYTIGIWGCGSNCGIVIVIDARTGTVYSPFGSLGFFYKGYYGDTPEKPAPEVEYKIQSNLLILRGCPETIERCATYFYEWTEGAFKLLREIPLDKSLN